MQNLQIEDTHIMCRDSKYLTKAFIFGGAPITPEDAEILFEGQRVLEAQFTSKVGVIVLLTEPPEESIYVADTTYLLPPKAFNEVDDVTHFLVNMPFCKAITTDFFDVFKLLTSNPELLTDNAPFLIGCINEQVKPYAEVSVKKESLEEVATTVKA